jgi:hypothetical protein
MHRRRQKRSIAQVVMAAIVPASSRSVNDAVRPFGGMQIPPVG